MIFRDDLQQKMQRHAILPPMTSEQENEEAADDDDDSETAPSVSQTHISKHVWFHAVLVDLMAVR